MNPDTLKVMNTKNPNIKTICVFASSSFDIDEKYFKDANALGEEIAKYGYDIVYGGSNRGLMGEVTTAAKKHGSKITGVMPEKLYKMGVDPGDCTEFILVKEMRERKAKMDELSEALIAIPGGFGTLEELSEMLVQKQLNYSNKPIVLLNTDGYYDSLVKFFDEIILKNFASKNSKKLFHIAKNPHDALEYINSYQFETVDYISKKLSVKNKITL